MKSFSLRLLVLSFLFAPVCLSVVRAQLPPNGIDFKTNSSFVAQNVIMPAGTYNIRPMQDDMETLVLSSSDGHAAIIPCEALESTGLAKTEITFHRYGQSLYLNQVWSAGQYRLPDSSWPRGKEGQKVRKADQGNRRWNGKVRRSVRAFTMGLTTCNSAHPAIS